ncbi:hypothetical protein [Noviherbaspirillum denitrificans]|uniref:Uncharacterized protein n=1 Tax=Noviherbaspirillum denitrificans TaxID=1968433 RepID=A0A254T6W6_9BURK|nr:hypothetical protein [Noviherbaspirillum denitrificans]OWW18399.1 hypothetical protein AYR66_00945 [Noviherbaspirillum denitrificans]OWW19363.1 hypothetical protein AYR66_07430 [Noviherbaspirillum denitrificans]
MDPERIEIVYFVRYFDPVRKRKAVTRYKLTEADARARYGEIELVEASREERRVGGDPRRNSAAHLHTGSPDKR